MRRCADIYVDICAEKVRAEECRPIHALLNTLTAQPAALNSRDPDCRNDVA